MLTIARESIITAIEQRVGREIAEAVVKDSGDRINIEDVMESVNIDKVKDLSEELVTELANFLTQAKYIEETGKFVEYGKKFGVCDSRTIKLCSEIFEKTRKCSNDFIASAGHKRYFNEEEEQQKKDRIQKILDEA